VGDVTYINQRQDDTVRCFEHGLKCAKEGDIELVLILTLDTEGSVTYSRAGVIRDAGSILSLIGSLEHHKAVLMEHLIDFDEAAKAEADAAAEAEENDESPDPS
jgi:hypothetical protein